MVGKRPNNPERGLIALCKAAGYRQGQAIPTGARWNRRSIKRAKLGTGDFFANCVWGPFRIPGERPRPFEMDIAFPYGGAGVDIEVDGLVYHSGYGKERDQARDAALKAAGWVVVRITTDQLYRVFIPLLNKMRKQKGATN